MCVCLMFVLVCVLVCVSDVCVGVCVEGLISFSCTVRCVALQKLTLMLMCDHESNDPQNK